jgi:hypothetical protein
VGAIESITIYAEGSDPKGLGARFQLSVIGTEVVYHLRYQVDKDSGWTTFALDPDKPQDITSASGSYLLEPIAGGHRVHYRSITDTGRWVPGFVRNSVATRSFSNQLEAMRDQAVK